MKISLLFQNGSQNTDFILLKNFCSKFKKKKKNNPKQTLSRKRLLSTIWLIVEHE